MEAEGSLPCSQHTATGHYHEPDESSPNPPTLFPEFTDRQKLATYRQRSEGHQWRTLL